EAVRNLQDIAKNATDPQAKKDAQDALKKEGQPVATGDKPGAEANAKDVQDIAKDMKGAQGQKKDQAARKLQDIAQNAKDPQDKKTAEEALKKEGQSTKPEPTPADVDALAKGMKNSDPQERQDLARMLQDIARNAKDPDIKKAAEEALQKEGIGIP